MVIDLTRDCDRIFLSEEHVISDFDCGNVDLNEFFNQDALQYRRQMLSETCFFLLVDAYNEPAVVRFYEKNKFTTVFSTEQQEKQTYRQQLTDTLQTRYMFYDMIQWRDRVM